MYGLVYQNVRIFKKNVRIVRIFFSKIVRIVRISSENVRIFERILFKKVLATL